MGKSGNRKKNKTASSGESKLQEQRPLPSAAAPASIPGGGTATVSGAPATANGTTVTPAKALKIEHFAAVFLRRANELKVEGNLRFQNKDYRGAMENYEQALRLTPRNHPDRAVFHSNRAACLMQMKPVQYEAVVRECTLALEVNPRFGRALLRRARALEALGKLEYALQDVLVMLQFDGNNTDAIELAKRIRSAIRNRQEGLNDKPPATHSLNRHPTAPSPPMPSPCAITSPAALGASVVNGSPIGAKGPAPKTTLKKKGGKPDQALATAKVSVSDARRSVSPSANDSKQDNPSSSPSPTTDVSDHGEQHPKDSSIMQPDFLNGKSSNLREIKTPPSVSLEKERAPKPRPKEKLPNRPLKLVYDHDIRRAQLPANCTYRELRELVKKRFPSSKAVLIKYRDEDGDLMTITNTEELKLAEETMSVKNGSKMDKSSGTVSNSLEPLRFYVVEVPPEQEPIVEKEDEDMHRESVCTGSEDSCLLETDAQRGDIQYLNGSIGAEGNIKVGKLTTSKFGEECKGKDAEMDDWLLDFAHLFRTHIGVDPDVHVDLHELGMELCSEALEETITSDEAQPLFEAAACKFQEVAALAFFNWGNVHMCAARKRIPLEENGDEAEFKERLQIAYDWAHGQYEQARMKYEDAIRVKPDFYEGILALGQESFESAKLEWSLAVARRVDLTTWDSSTVLELFKKAEDRMQVAVGMWEKLKEQRLKEAKVVLPTKKTVLKSEAQDQRDAQAMSEAETQEQFLVMGFQINLFWGNILFEHSQVEYKLDLPSWKALLDEAVQRFELAGATPTDIAVVLKNHVSNFTCSCEASKPASQMCKIAGTHDHDEATSTAHDCLAAV